MILIKQFLKHSLRSGSPFKRFLHEAAQRRSFTREQIAAYHKDKLKETLEWARASVPAYQDLPSADILDAPHTDKQAVRGRIDAFKSARFKGRSFQAQTSGTTGSPSVFLRDLNSINVEQAILWREWMRAGKKNGSRRAVLRGDVVCAPEKSTPPFWRVDPFAKQLILSSFHLSDRNLPAYADQIRRYQPFDLQAYPSTAYLLADFCLRTDARLSLGAVFTSSEQLFDYQRQTIESAFGCKVYDWYGQAERVAAIAMCERQTYHVIEDYSYVEFLPTRDGLHEIVGTTFHNRVMPLIRYRTGDFVSLSPGAVCECGSSSRCILSISGREGTYIRTSDNRLIGSGGLSRIMWGVQNIIEMQFVQVSQEEILMKVVATSDFSSTDQALLIRNAKERISGAMKYRIEKVTSIPRSPAGKFEPVVSRLARE